VFAGAGVGGQEIIFAGGAAMCKREGCALAFQGESAGGALNRASSPQVARRDEASLHPRLSMKGFSESRAHIKLGGLFPFLKCAFFFAFSPHARSITGVGLNRFSIGPSIHSCWPPIVPCADRGGTLSRPVRAAHLQ